MLVNTFSGPVRCEWVVDDPRDMILIESLSFADTQRIWTAPKGTRINGVSIPRLLWPIVGSPYVSMARRISVLHDYYFQIRTFPTIEVNRMFYFGCLVDGISENKASTMYEALMAFGMRWDEDGNIIKQEESTDELYPFDLTGQLD